MRRFLLAAATVMTMLALAVPALAADEVAVLTITGNGVRVRGYPLGTADMSNVNPDMSCEKGDRFIALAKPETADDGSKWYEIMAKFEADGGMSSIGNDCWFVSAKFAKLSKPTKKDLAAYAKYQKDLAEEEE
jgi:hypothetical protein